jgi:hypothetical protein
MYDLVESLSKLESGYLQAEVFNEIARLVVLPTVVLIPFIRLNSNLKVLLTKRSSDDAYYPNMLHPPGTVLRSTDKSIQSAIERLKKTELAGVTFKGELVFVNFVFENIARGKELSLIFLTELLDVPSDYQLYMTDQLPLDLIQTDYTRIKSALERINN